MEQVLLSKSPDAWAKHILDHFDDFLRDHASCERKAAALAMSFVTKYPDRDAIIEPMVSLAREELEHFHQVFHILRKRGQQLGRADHKDFYINEILSHLRHGRDERFLDRLIMSGLVEARGHERFSLLAQHMEAGKMRDFYTQLAEREAGHYKIFIRLARLYFDADTVKEAVARIQKVESEAMLKAPLNATLH
ncbi:MAG: tRNA-(ms[2]io[6]A)-hydroxylase [Zetaproteobacteria bacterium]|nr:tRNA-(ms[2]io[6]A)-hydroxylase [Zetaproteobacteria bacterium]